MPAAKIEAITLPAAQLRVAQRLARLENRTVSELVAEALRRYTRQPRTKSNGLLAAMQTVQESARKAGLAGMSMREIDAEVAAVRKARKAVRK